MAEGLLDGLDWPRCVYGVPGRGARDNAEAHLGKKHHFVTDIRDFYPWTNVDVVYDVFTSNPLNFTPDAARIATRLTTLDGGLPQGVHTSARLADLAFRGIDEKLSAFCSEQNITYTRYADDLSFSSQEPFQEEVLTLKSIVHDDDRPYRLHAGSKTYYKKGPVEVTGVVVENNGLSAPERLHIKLRDHPIHSEVAHGLRGYISYVQAV
jgi:hypothetical protein